MELDCLISGEHDWQEEQAARANESCELLTHPEEAPVLLKAVAQVLLNAVEKAERVDRLTDNEDVDMATRLTPFHGAQPPAISLYDYLTRIARHAKMSPACFVVALMLIDEACTKEPALGPTQLTVHRLVLAALVLAAKSCEDETYKNGFLAKVGGIPLSELNAMELQLLLLLDFQLHKPPSATNAVVQALLTGTHQLGSRWPSTAPGHQTTDQLATARQEGPRAEGSSPAPRLSTAPAPAQQEEATGLPLEGEQLPPASSPRAQSLTLKLQLHVVRGGAAAAP
ncbi:cyclin-domain-containing protein [Haematococcus lacustris]